jgi:hypothetical protein
MTRIERCGPHSCTVERTRLPGPAALRKLANVGGWRKASRRPLPSIGLLLVLPSVWLLACNALLDFSEGSPDSGHIEDSSVGADGTNRDDSGADGSTDSHTDAAVEAAADSSTRIDGGDACAPLMCDPANCGAAGHDCLGGACVAGDCQPVVLASLSSPKYIGLGQDSVYVTEQGNAADVRAVSKNGGAVQTIVPSGTFTGHPADLVVGSQRVYWANDALANVYSVELDGGNPTTAFTGGAAVPRRLASDGVDVYWTVATMTTAVDRGVLPSGVASALGDDSSFNASAIALNGAGTFWLASSMTASHLAFVARSCALTPCVAQILYASPSDSNALQAIVADDAGVYFGDNAQGVLLAISTDGGTTELAVTTVSEPVYSLALDATTLYWADELPMGAVKSVMRNGHGATTLARQRASPRSLAVDGQAIYWLEGPPSGGQGQLVKLAK